MFDSTLELSLSDLGHITGNRLDARQQYTLARCIELAQLAGYSRADFIQEFIEDKHPELRDFIIRCWYIT